MMTDLDENTVDHELECVASELLESIGVEEKAAIEERNSLSGRSSVGTEHYNMFNNQQIVHRQRSGVEHELANLEQTIRQPVVARIDYSDEEGVKRTVYVARGAAASVAGFQVISYRSALGRLAAYEAGSDVDLTTPGGERELYISARAVISPHKDGTLWDARDCSIELNEQDVFSIRSLREHIKHRSDIPDEDLDIHWQDDDSQNLERGYRRAILSHIGLRDQPILDRHQDEIFRMPVNTKCFLSGPPGTGKTTTLIRRLGQKTDRHALRERPEELRLIERIEAETGSPHETNWIVFSPTELLRQYVKEAFAREGLAASDAQIRTWDEFRREIARDTLKLLRTSNGNGPFVERRTQSYLADETDDDAAWFDDFRSYLDASFFNELKVDTNWLAGRPAGDLSKIGRSLTEAFNIPRKDMYAHALSSVAELGPDISEAVTTRNIAVSRLLAKARNALVFEDRSFPKTLRDEISRQLADAAQVAEEEAEFEVALDDEDQIGVEPQSGRPVSLQQALGRLERALKTLAKARLAGRSVSERSQDGLLLAWLGEKRLPPAEDLKSMGELLAEQTRIRKFERLERLFLRGIAPKYKRYRGDRAEALRWYSSAPSKASDIFWKELDLVVLASLQIANELMEYHRKQVADGSPRQGFSEILRNLYRAQVLVDEVTDFSRVQLACMHEIAHPILSSFFVCGDINQRLTSWGLKSNAALDWIASGILRRSITVSYRQSQRLVDLAKDVAALGGSVAEDIILPERLDVEGLAPVWQDRLGEYAEVSDWLTSRIREIDRMLGQSTTIAVLVNDEADVEPLALTLNDRLEEISLAAVACKDGKVVGSDRDVRVFDIRHIKGLEFEAVFFVGLDKTVAKHPELYTKFLYVGATRAANYLGVTFAGPIPDVIAPLAAHFKKGW